MTKKALEVTSNLAQHEKATFREKEKGQKRIQAEANMLAKNHTLMQLSNKLN